MIDLDGGPLLDRVHVDRDATAVVLDPDAAVGEQGDPDGVAVAGQRLVDGVVDDLPHHVVQAALAGGADVHTGALADRLEALENGDGAAGVGVLGGAVGLRSSDHVGPSFRATGTPLPPVRADGDAVHGRGLGGRRTALGRLLAVSVVQDTGSTDRNAAVHALTSCLRLFRLAPPPPVLPRGSTRRPRGPSARGRPQFRGPVGPSPLQVRWGPTGGTSARSAG